MNEEPNPMDESELFQLFFRELREEALSNGETFDLNEDEARELFDLMQEEFLSELHDDEDFVSSESEEFDQDSKGFTTPLDQSFGDQVATIESSSDDLLTDMANSSAPVTSDEPIETISLAHQNPERLAKIELLQEVLPGLPLSRINKVVDAFEKTLGYPSMLTLVPILRETMPDHVTSRWLRRVNNSNAEFALRKASDDNQVDVSLLNSMLEVKANYGFIQGAIDFHEDQYKKHGKVCSMYASCL